MCKLGDATTTPAARSSNRDIQVDDEDAWVLKVDLRKFGEEVRELGETLRANQGVEDDEHLYKIIRWQVIATVVGISTLWLPLNLVTVAALSLGVHMRWTCIGHHVVHNGYSNTKASEKGYNQFVFAVGSFFRRFIDWFDWMLPEAWNLEHGRLHHYSLNEEQDPDLVQLNGRFVQDLKAPLFVKYAIVAFFAATWKWTYYACNTYSELLFSQALRKARSSGNEADKQALFAEKKEFRTVTFFTIFSEAPSWWSTPKFLVHVFAPYLLFRFFVLPSPFYFLLGKQAFFNAIMNLIAAEVLTNVHGFLTIVPNHAGSDLYYFETHCEPKSDEFYLRQVIGSVDFSVGNDLIDVFHGFLSYQIEHHAWPDLSMRSYQKAHPLLKEICIRHGVPFVQHSVFYRLLKTVRVFTGEENMRKFPQHLLDTR